MYVHTYAHIHTCTYTHMHAGTYKCMRIYAYAPIHTLYNHICTHKHVCTHDSNLDDAEQKIVFEFGDNMSARFVRVTCKG